MIRALLLFVIIMTIISGLIFGYKAINKSEVVVSGKLIIAAIVSMFFTAVIFFLETQ